MKTQHTLLKRMGPLDVGISFGGPNAPWGHILWRGGPGFSIGTRQRSARFRWEHHRPYSDWRGEWHNTRYFHVSMGHPHIHKPWAFSAYFYVWGS